MRLRYKVTGAILILVAVALVSLGLALSHDSPCTPSPAPPAAATLMKAIVSRCYGSPEVLRFEDIAKPTIEDHQMLIRVHAAAVNPLDWHYMRGAPYVMRAEAGLGSPSNPRLGVDFSGTVEAVGKNVTSFRAGDEVFGGANGSFAEYVRVREAGTVALKPANVTFEQAGTAAVAGITALQALRDKGGVKPGQKVLINGASGGVGTYAVQIAKSMGAEVTGVCSTRNVELVRSIGADHVVDYTQEDFTKRDERYDLIVDNVGNHQLRAYRRILKPEGRYVMIGGPNTGKWLGPLSGAVKAALFAPFVKQQFGMHLATLNQQDIKTLADLMQEGKLTPVIDRQYPLREVPQAIAYIEEGRARGKVVITVE